MKRVEEGLICFSLSPPLNMALTHLISLSHIIHVMTRTFPDSRQQTQNSIDMMF
jgi:hypothetical protein